MNKRTKGELDVHAPEYVSQCRLDVQGEQRKETENMSDKGTKFAYYHDNGKISGMQQFDGGGDDRIRDGIQMYWHYNGARYIEETYVKGKREGRTTYWHDNGQKMMEGEYRNDKKHGHWLGWTREGEGYEADFVDGQRVGVGEGDDDCPTCMGSTEGCRDCYDTCGSGPVSTDESRGGSYA